MQNIEVIDFPSEDIIYGDVKPFSTQGMELFKKWLIDNCVSYYGRCKEDFSMIEAYALAKEEGNSKLIVENYS